jgi:transketolase
MVLVGADARSVRSRLRLTIVLLTSQNVRRLILQSSWRAGVGHIGSALSVADILTALYSGILTNERPSAPDRDRFVLSKGHAALALYAVLCLKGWLTPEELSTYCSDATMLGVHPERALPGVDFSTGSLGHGLSFGAGAALAALMDGSARRAFVLLSDAECNEGSVWEAVMFAAHHRLSNLVAIVDVNGQQALGYTRDVLSMTPLADRWRAFGWDVREIDGHDVPGLAAAVEGLDRRSGPPHVLLANTTFGKGVSFMERRIEWHYLPMTAVQYEQAMREVHGDA